MYFLYAYLDVIKLFSFRLCGARCSWCEFYNAFYFIVISWLQSYKAYFLV